MGDQSTSIPDPATLAELILAVWTEAQPSETTEWHPVTDQQFADAGPYTLQQVREFLLAKQGDDYVVKRDGETIYMLAPQTPGV
jgi:hypothetical protein